MAVSLKNKRVLITAGPTWSAIDDVRVISNISTGLMGVLLARAVRRAGASVDLFLGPVGDVALPRGVRVKRFFYFSELKEMLETSLGRRRYDILLHAAAVSDYIAAGVKGKIRSDKDTLRLTLRRAPKLIRSMRRLNPGARLVMFKLESAVSSRELLRRGRAALREYRADLAVANAVSGRRGYKGFILDAEQVRAAASSRAQLVRRLVRLLSEESDR